MATVIGGAGTGLLDSSLYLLNRNDNTRDGQAGHGEEVYVNVSNGNLVIRHVDAYLPSQGEDYALVRTYNSRGSWNSEVGKGWTLTSFLELSQVTNNQIILINPDSSQFVFTYDSASGNYRSVDGVGAYEEIVYDKTAKTYTLVRANQTRLFFDINGTMVRSQDPAGNVMNYSYSGGKLVSIQDDTGHTITYRYTGSDLTSVVDETGVVLASYTYSSSLLMTSTDRSGHVTRYDYYTDNRIRSLTLPFNPAAGEAARTISFTYVPDPTDSTGKTRILDTLTDAEGNTTYFKYQFNVDNYSKYNGGTTWMLDALGAKRMQSNEAEYVQWRRDNGYYDTWDANLYATSPSYKAQADQIAARHTTVFDYDRNGEILSVTDAKGYITRYSYDALENLTAILDANGDAITRSDDPYWRTLRQELGYVNSLTGAGKLVAELTSGEIAALKELYTTHFEYDARGNLVRRIDAEDNITTYTYTSFNKLASATSAMGYALAGSDESLYQQKRVELGYAQYVANLTSADKQALLDLYTTVYAYDSRQNLIEIRNPGGDLTRFAYDAFGNLTTKTVYLDQTNLTDPSLQQVTRYLYDAYGNNTATIEANAWPVTHSDDAYWRDLRRDYGVVDASGQGKLVATLTSADISLLEGRYTSHASYDHFGNRTRFIDANGGVTTYTYDQDNRLTTVTDPEGHVTVNTYDSVGNRTAIRTGAVRDAGGNVIGGHTVIYVYDRNNMLIKVVDPSDTSVGLDRTTQYKYDVLGQRTAILDAEGRTTTYVYREDRRLVEVITPIVQNAQGVNVQYRTTYSYDAVGNRLTVTDNNGNVTQYAYNRDNLVKQVRDAIGNITQYQYDANLKQVSIVIGAQLAAADRRVLRYTYDEENQLVAEVDALGHTTRYSYDAAGNRIEVIDANGHSRGFEYDRQNRLIREVSPEVIDPRTGQPTRYTVTHTLDGNGNEIATTDAEGHTARVAYDKDNRAVLVTDANGNQVAYTYDARHNRTSVQLGVTAHLDASGHVVIDSTVNAQVTTYSYNEFNELVARTDGNGNALATSDSAFYQQQRLELGYARLVADLATADKNALRNLYTERYAYDKVGNRTAFTDNSAHTTAFAYDALNRLTARTDALGHATRYAYDGNGNRVRVTDANNHQTTYTYDAVNRLTDNTDALGVVTHRDYDHVGNLVSETRAAGTDEARTTTYVYDLNNRLTSATDPLSHTVAYEYDAVGNRLKVIDARHQTTEYVYDALNRTVKVIDPLTFETRYEYDGVGNRLTVIDARGGITRMTYDPGNRLLRLTDAEDRKTEFTYDARNNRITQTTAAGTSEAETTTYTYDAENNLIEVLDAEGHTTLQAYDRVYNRIATTDGNGHTAHYAFDAVNRMIEVVDAEGGKTTYTYDAVGNRLSVTDANGHALAAQAPTEAEKAAVLEAHTTHYGYDERNQLLTETDAHDVVTAYGYDRVGNRVTVTRAFDTPEAQTTTYVYNKDDQLIRQIDALGHPTRYEYDANHNLVRTIDALGRITAYDYDANNRVTRIVDAIGMGLASSDAAEYQAARRSLGYPALVADLTSAQIEALKAAHATTYRYDSNGNRTQVRDALGHTTTSYYNHNNEVTLMVDAEGALTGYQYDANGNRVAVTRYATPVAMPVDPAVTPAVTDDAAHDETTRYAYDKRNRLVRVLDAEGHVVDSRYDAAGNLIATEAYANAIAYDPARPLREQTPVADGRDRLIQYSYDATNRLVTSVDAEGFRTGYGYDAVGNRVSQTLYLSQSDFTDPALQQTTRFSYDALNRLTSQVSAIGVETRHSYDELGNRRTTTEAYGLPKARTFEYVYDDLNRLTDEINPEGTVTHHAYDAVGQMIGHYEGYGRADQRYTERSYDGLGRLISQTTPDGVRAEYAYDAVGNLTAKTDAANTADARTSTYVYDRNNRLTRETLAVDTEATIARTFVYDAFSNRITETVGADTADARVTQYAYDRTNRRIAETDGNGVTTLYDYNAFGNLIARSVTDRASGRTETVAMTYDGRNLLLTDANGEGEVIAREYDAAGNLRFETAGFGSAAAATTEYRYDQANRLTDRIVDPTGLHLTTHYEYDARNNLTTERDANGHTRTTAYDEMNRAVTVTDALGFSVSFGYDVYGNQTAITTGQYLVVDSDPAYDPAKAAVVMPATTRFAYDTMNRQTHRADALGVVTRFTYDARGNRLSQTEAYGSLAAGLELTDANIAPITDTAARVSLYVYDHADRLVQETQPAGTVVRHSYTGAGELVSKIVDYGMGATHKNATTASYYDAGGRKEYEVDPVGSVTRFEYDDFGNVLRITRGLALGADGRPSAAPTSAMRQTAYSYDLANRVLSETVDPDGLGLTTGFEYDARGNRTAIIDANGHRGESVYDAANRVIWQRDGEGYIVRFEHDAKGNKLTETRYATNGAGLLPGELPASSAADEITRFAYDANDRLTERTDPRGVINRLTYDALGNVLANTENATGLYGSPARTKTFTYTLANLVHEQVEASGLVTRLEYDAVYNAVRRTEINTWIDTLNPDAQGNPTVRTEERVFEFGYDLNNRLTEEVTDPAGLNLRKSYRYDGLGNRIAEVGANGYAAIRDDSAWAQAIRQGLGLTDAAGHALPAASLTDTQKQQVLDAFTTRTYFDAAARPRFTVDPLGYVKEVRYDAVGNMTTAVQYANPVDINTLTDAMPPSVVADPAHDRTVEYRYDKANRQVEARLDAVRVFVNGEWVDNHRPTTTTTYDGVGNIASETDANGYTTYHYYNSNGLEAGKIDAEGYLTINEYDAFGNKTTETLYLDRQALSDAEKQVLDLGTYTPVGEARIVEHVYDLGNNEIETVLPPATLYRDGVTSTEVLRVTRSFDAFRLVRTESVIHAASDTNVAFKSFGYDAAGRLILEIAARAEELILSDDAYFVDLRRDLGYVNASGQGKLAAELTDADKAEIRAAFATHYAYDAANNLRERVEGDRITTFEYDTADRSTRVHLPAVDIVEVDANGNRTMQSGYRFVAEMGYDAAGNMVRELKADGTEILHRYDRANREIGAVDDNNVYTEYGYDFSGNRTLIHRYFTPIADRSNPQPPAVHAADQEIRFEFDHVGRMVKEWQLGEAAVATDDRIGRFGYDANGNQVEIVDGRGYSSTLIYDALNRMIGTVNPAGGLTATFYDAMGNVIGRQAGGFLAPTLVDGKLTASLRANDGMTIAWQTDHATNGLVYVRRAGSMDAWQTFGTAGSYALAHEVTLTGLGAGTQYEYYIVSQDIFGNQISSDTHSFQTVAGAEGAILTNIRPEGTGYAADLSFALPASAQFVVAVVGRLADDGVTLIDEVLFEPVAQGDGSYAVTLAFSDPATAYFQIRWRDSGSDQATQVSAVEQRQELRIFDGTATAVASSTQGYDLTVTWDLSTALAQNGIRSYTDATTGERRYNVFVGYALVEGQEPLYVEATLTANGVFSAEFDAVADAPRTLSFYYVAGDGTIVTAAPQVLPGLAGLNAHLQRIELAFPDMDTSGTTLAFRYRATGSSTWTSLPASAINGLSVDVLGVGEGDFEYQADLLSGGKVLRTSSGSFTLREPGSVSNLVDAPVVANVSDAANPGVPVSYTLEGTVLSFPALLPLLAGDALSLTVTDGSGVTTSYPFSNASFDLAQLTAGDYTLQILKTHTETTVDPVTGQPVTTTTVVNDITASVTVKPPVAYTQSDNLATFTGLLPLNAGDSVTLEVTDTDGNTTSYPVVDASFDLTVLDPGSYTLHLVKTHTETVTTPVLDANGQPVLDPVTGQPLTQTTTTVTVLADIRGDIFVQPRTLTGAQADALSGVRDLTSFALSEPESVFVGITTTSVSTSADHVFSYYDDNGWKTFSNEQGGVWTRYFYDAQGNVTREVRFRRRDDQGNFLNQIVDPGVRPDLATLLADYDAAMAAHDPATGVDTVRVIERRYDAEGHKLSESGISQAYGRVTDEWRYDRFGNIVRETVQKGVLDRELSTERSYDAFNRVIQTSVGPFQYFDSNGNPYYAPATTTIGYDRDGNKSTELDERGYLKRFHYDEVGRLSREWDAAKLYEDGSLSGSGLRTDYAYDSFGRVLSRTLTDLTGRASAATHVTTFEYDHFDQVRAYEVAGERTSFAYDAAGNKISDTNARGYTESFTYDAENRVIAHTDRLGNVSGKSYDAYGHLLSEIDGNGRVTTYTIGAYGQLLEKHTALTGGIPVVTQKGKEFTFRFFGKTWTFKQPDTVRNTLSGAATQTENSSYDWLGRATAVTDSYGKHITYGYDDADRLRKTTDFATNQYADYTYDTAGNRLHETITRAGEVVREQTNTYNERGWLTGVDTNAGMSFSGSTLDAPVHLFFRYDQAGNRVWVGDNQYTYDGENRMVYAYDGKAKQTVDAIQYDGFGNRVAITQAGTTITYSYDARQRVVSASNGEVWQYDELGNNTYHRAANGDTTTTTYDAENRALTTASVAGGDTTNTRNHYDGAGNLAMTSISGKGYGFNEVTYRDVLYNETLKRIENGWADGAAGLIGQTTFVRNANGELVSFDRGKGKTGYFTYDLEGHILSRADRPTNNTDGAYIEGFVNDPDARYGLDEYGGWNFVTYLRRKRQFGAATQGVTQLKSYVYANGKPVAEAATEHTLTQKKLTLTGGTPVTDADGNLTGWTVTLQAADLAYKADGSLDRQQTALNLAARVYDNFAGLSSESKERVASRLEVRFPPADADVKAGAVIGADGYLLLNDGQYNNTNITTDYFVRQIGDGMPQGTAITYTARAGDSLMSIAAQYYGSPAYWYLIAEANGLSAMDELKEGATLTIPNRVANCLNDASTYKLYNENDIIGSTSPEVITVPKPKKKKKWYQKLLQVVIIVIIIVAAIFTAGAALGAMGLAAGALGAIGTAGAAFGAAVATSLGVAALTGVVGVIAGLALAATLGYAIGVATSIVTQGLAILGGLQEEFSWKGVRDMGKSFAVSALTAAAGGWVSQASNLTGGYRAAAQGAIAAGGQYLENGKITNYSGILLAMIPGGAASSDSLWGKTVNFVNENKKAVGAGLSILEKRVRGDEVNALDWANAAMAVVQDRATGAGNYLSSKGEIKWGAVAGQALIATGAALYVGNRMGEDAALSFLGNQYGAIVQGIEAEQGLYKTMQERILRDEDSMKDRFEKRRITQEEFDQNWNDEAKSPYERAEALNKLVADREQQIQALLVEMQKQQAEAERREQAYRERGLLGSVERAQGLEPGSLRYDTAEDVAGGRVVQTSATGSESLWDLEGWGGVYDDGSSIESGAGSTPQAEAVAGKQEDKPLQLGANERYRDAIEKAAERTGMDPAAIAALIDAESVKYSGASLTQATDEEFYARHPELNGRVLTKGDAALIKEWKSINQELGQVWDPNSMNDPNNMLKAAGLTQFLAKTWNTEAQRSGTYLNEVAKEKGYVDANNKIVKGQEDKLLNLRFDPEVSIVAGAEYAMSGLKSLSAISTTDVKAIDKEFYARHPELNGRPLTSATSDAELRQEWKSIAQQSRSPLLPTDLTSDQKAQYAYIAHHEGLDGAIAFLGGTPQDARNALTDARGRYLLEAQFTNSKGIINQSSVDYWLKQGNNNGAEAYRQFLWDYTNKKIQPQRFR